MTKTARRASFRETRITNIHLHPAVRARLEAELAEAKTQLKLANGGLLQILAQPEYRAATLARARREGISLQAMHQRGVDGLRKQVETRISELRTALALD